MTPGVDLEILTVAVYPRIGGMTSWIDRIIRRLSQFGWNIRLVAVSDRLSEAYETAGCEIVHIPTAPVGMSDGLMDKVFRWRGVRQKLSRHATQASPPRLLLSDSTPGVIRAASRYARKAGVPWVVLAGGNIFSETRSQFLAPLLHSQIRTDLLQAEKVFVDGPDLVDSLEVEGIASGKIEIQYPGINLEEFPERPMQARYYPARDETLRLGWHGRHTEPNGVLRFIDLAQHCRKGISRFCGDGPLREQAVLKLSELGHPEWYLGPLECHQIPGFLGEADCGLYPLEKMAGVPRVLMEAMAAGQAALTYPVGAVNELIENEVNGFLCRDAEDMLEKAHILQGHPELMERLGRSARETIRQNWSEEHLLRQFAVRLEEISRPCSP
ncbi:MAG: Glycosyl transferase group 1 [Candidatus Hinthialibacteria bacterium OLB16]|nr:MAG: Glycosyl transferase group 1 [Candidatus Hinthialibacteria bacterium OLB16]